MLSRAMKDEQKLIETLTMPLPGNRRDSTHDIYVRNRRYSAKTTLTHFIADAKLDEILNISFAGMLPWAMKRCTKIYRNFDDAITRESAR